MGLRWISYTSAETAAWVTALMREWDDRVRTEYNVGSLVGLSPGFVLARAMTANVATVFPPAASLPASNY